MIRLSFLLMLIGSFLTCSAGGQQLKKETRSASNSPGWKTYIDTRHTLQNIGEHIDYDTLMQTYQAMAQTQHEIPHMDRLLKSLIDKRNKNQRIDQMILIFAARALGDSKFAVTDAYGIFEAILAKDDRLTEWVLAFVAAAIGDYPVDLPKGNTLVDLTEKKLAMVISAPGPKKEYFGHHFLPPPKGEYIRSYIANIQSRAIRTSERYAYYTLVANGYAEIDIEKALRQLLSNGTKGKQAPPIAPMKHLVQNIDQTLK